MSKELTRPELNFLVDEGIKTFRGIEKYIPPTDKELNELYNGLSSSIAIFEMINNSRENQAILEQAIFCFAEGEQGLKL